MVNHTKTSLIIAALMATTWAQTSEANVVMGWGVTTDYNDPSGIKVTTLEYPPYFPDGGNNADPWPGGGQDSYPYDRNGDGVFSKSGALGTEEYAFFDLRAGWGNQGPKANAVTLPYISFTSTDMNHLAMQMQASQTQRRQIKETSNNPYYDSIVFVDAAVAKAIEELDAPLLQGVVVKFVKIQGEPESRPAVGLVSAAKQKRGEAYLKRVSIDAGIIANLLDAQLNQVGEITS